MKLGPLAAPAVLTLVFAGCAADEAAAPNSEPPADQALYGDAVYQGSACTPSVTNLVNEALFWGRVSSNSTAFGQCIEQAVSGGATWTGQYRQCNGDPFFGADASTQIVSALEASRSLNDVTINCNGVPGKDGAPGVFVAFAWPGTYDRESPEEFTFNQTWLTGVAGSLNDPLCSTLPPNSKLPCRAGPHPWPLHDIANRVWHESSHQHGYDHGHSDDPAANATTCGYPGDATFDYQSNSMPYIIGNCLSAVIDHSVTTCGDPAQGCGPGELRLVSGVGAATCECVKDAKWDRIGGAAGSVYLGGFGIFASNPNNGELLRFDAGTGSWSVVATPAAQFAVSDNALFAISKENNTVHMFDGQLWQQVAPPSWLLVPGGKDMYAVFEDGSLRRYPGAPDQPWTKLDAGGQASYVANDNDVFAISGDQRSVLRYTGTGQTWEVIGGATRGLVAGGNMLISIDPQTGDLWRWDGAPNAWRKVGGPAKSVVVNRLGAYASSPAGSSVYKLSPGQDAFLPVAGLSITDIFAGGDKVVARRNNGDLMVPQNP